MTIKLIGNLAGKRAFLKYRNRKSGKFLLSSNIMATQMAAEMRKIYVNSGRVNTGDLVRSIRARRLAPGLSRIQLGNKKTLRTEGKGAPFNYAYAVELGINPRNTFVIGPSSAKGYFTGKTGQPVRRRFYPAVNSFEKAFRRVRARMIQSGALLR
tara:strand:- start:59 stop:523 length:465 start_codon:yes stop_codon:yes gene_type:complete